MEGGKCGMRSGRAGLETVGAVGRAARGNMVAVQKQEQWRAEVGLKKEGEKRDGGL